MEQLQPLGTTITSSSMKVNTVSQDNFIRDQHFNHFTSKIRTSWLETHLVISASIGQTTFWRTVFFFLHANDFLRGGAGCGDDPLTAIINVLVHNNRLQPRLKLSAVWSADLRPATKHNLMSQEESAAVWRWVHQRAAFPRVPCRRFTSCIRRQHQSVRAFVRHSCVCERGFRWFSEPLRVSSNQKESWEAPSFLHSFIHLFTGWVNFDPMRCRGWKRSRDWLGGMEELLDKDHADWIWWFLSVWMMRAAKMKWMKYSQREKRLRTELLNLWLLVWSLSFRGRVGSMFALICRLFLLSQLIQNEYLVSRNINPVILSSSGWYKVRWSEHFKQKKQNLKQKKWPK